MYLLSPDVSKVIHFFIRKRLSAYNRQNPTRQTSKAVIQRLVVGHIRQLLEKLK